MNNFNTIIEMAMNSLQLKGDWGKNAPTRAFDRPSIGILTSPSGVKKIKNMWKKLDHSVDVYVLRSVEGKDHVEYGMVDPQFVKDKLKLDIELDPEAITIIFTNNVASEKIPLTGWTLAHRFGHSLRRRNGLLINPKNSYTFFDSFNQIQKTLDDILREMSKVYRIQLNDTNIRRMYYHIGKFKSARDRNIPRLSEFIYELIAQHIIQGGVIFNTSLDPIPLNSAWGKKRFAHSNPKEDLEDWENYLNRCAADISYYIDQMLGDAIGNVFVM